MQNYKLEKVLGDGTYGVVYRGIYLPTGERVAIKKMKKKYKSEKDFLKQAEIVCCYTFSHNCIVKTREIIYENQELLIIFEYLEQNLYEYYKQIKDKQQWIPEENIKLIIYQLALGLQYMHSQGYMHRDIKPENILISNNNTVKITDFGLAKYYSVPPPHTDYVSTRWYRAPEILLRQPNYSIQSDIFALGCIMAELYLLNPLFCGQSEYDHLQQIYSILGTPTSDIWPLGTLLAQNLELDSPFYSPIPLNSIITNASHTAIHLLYGMLTYDPNQRLTATQILQHEFFNGILPTKTYGADAHSKQKRGRSTSSKALKQRLIGDNSKLMKLPRALTLKKNVKAVYFNEAPKVEPRKEQIKGRTGQSIKNIAMGIKIPKSINQQQEYIINTPSSSSNNTTQNYYNNPFIQQTQYTTINVSPSLTNHSEYQYQSTTTNSNSSRSQQHKFNKKNIEFNNNNNNNYYTNQLNQNSEYGELCKNQQSNTNNNNINNNNNNNNNNFEGNFTFFIKSESSHKENQKIQRKHSNPFIHHIDKSPSVKNGKTMAEQTRARVRQETFEDYTCNNYGNPTPFKLNENTINNNMYSQYYAPPPPTHHKDDTKPKLYDIEYSIPLDLKFQKS